MFKMLKILAVLCLFVLVAGAGLGYYAMTQFQPVSQDSKKVTFTVNKGEGASSIAIDLQDQHLIKNALAFRALVWKNSLNSKILPGSYLLSEDMTPQQIALELTTPPTSLRITVKQGLRREELAEFLATQELTAFDKTEFLTLTKGEEGYLFPDTYLISREATTQSIATLFRSTFDKKVTDGIVDEIAASPHSIKDAVILASILEREAKRPTAADPDPTDMRIVAGILWNRIDAGIPLSVDSSLEYVGGYDAKQKTWWAESYVVNNKASNSPYNTYKFAGLPPGPISNPAVAAIEASLKPIASDSLYYLYGNDGLLHVAKTLDEHNVNIKKYLQ